MPCKSVPKGKVLSDKYDLKSLLKDWRAHYPEETQLNGLSEPSEKAWIHFKYTPPELTGSKMMWKLNADTHSSAVDQFITEGQFKLDKLENGVRVLKLGDASPTHGWNCYEVTK